MKNEITKQDIIDYILINFRNKGIKLRISEIAEDLNTSKRTIYKFFSSKEDLLESTIEFVFLDIEKQHLEIIKNENDTLTKLKQVLLVYPQVINIEDAHLEKFKQMAPKLHKLILAKLASNWELTLEIFDKCKNEGYINDFDRQAFRLVLLSIYENSLNFENHKQIVNQCVDMIFNGLAKKEAICQK